MYINDKDFKEYMRADARMDSIYPMIKKGVPEEEILAYIGNDKATLDLYYRYRYDRREYNVKDDGRCVDNRTHQNELGSCYERSVKATCKADV